MANADCPRCLSAVALHEGRPFVTAAGAVELWHFACWARRDEPLVEDSIAPLLARAQTVPPRPSKRRQGVIATGLAAAAVLGIAFTQLRTGDAAPPRGLVNVEIGTLESVSVGSQLAASDSPPPPIIETKDQQRWPVPLVDGARLDATFSSLATWIHPVTASPEYMPAMTSRHFGAERAGIERAECGAGHCGVDLHAPRGTPLVAVADAVVVRVERSELGRDGRSGRYVRLLHEDGTLTSYMHMDDVAAVQVGDRVHAGQYIGTLGATAVYSAPPHLHFSLEVPNRPGTVSGDTTDTHYIDPAPYLVRAMIVPVPDRRRPQRPAM
ncbi:MAG TPA: M23 family metallopeptidase [Kofleriaceae bacterium]|jgi:murein DD-endopeptidase MepM/ murein hydrolase activator NlpD|nr:M23 family metallopeptidase [Kofleriaceae bacterium]